MRGECPGHVKNLRVEAPGRAGRCGKWRTLRGRLAAPKVLRNHQRDGKKLRGGGCGRPEQLATGAHYGLAGVKNGLDDAPCERAPTCLAGVTNEFEDAPCRRAPRRAAGLAAVRQQRTVLRAHDHCRKWDLREVLRGAKFDGRQEQTEARGCLRGGGGSRGCEDGTEDGCVAYGKWQLRGDVPGPKLRGEEPGAKLRGAVAGASEEVWHLRGDDRGANLWLGLQHSRGAGRHENGDQDLRKLRGEDCEATIEGQRKRWHSPAQAAALATGES